MLKLYKPKNIYPMKIEIYKYEYTFVVENDRYIENIYIILSRYFLAFKKCVKLYVKIFMFYLGGSMLKWPIKQEERRQISLNFRAVYHMHRKTLRNILRKHLDNGWKYNIFVVQPLYHRKSHKNNQTTTYQWFEA